jgi:hypothetical protein
MYTANTLLFSSTGRSAIEIKKDNGDGTFATIQFTKDENGRLKFECGEYVTPSEKITSILDDDLTNSKDRV